MQNKAELVRDAVVCAPTGSGKTLVYVLALLQVRAWQTKRGGWMDGSVGDLVLRGFSTFTCILH